MSLLDTAVKTVIPHELRANWTFVRYTAVPAEDLGDSCPFVFEMNLVKSQTFNRSVSTSSDPA